MTELEEMAEDLAEFLGHDLVSVQQRLSLGWEVNHAAVAQDFRAAAPQSDAELLTWYRATEAYLWELAYYHTDAGFNYKGKCQGIAERLRSIFPGHATGIALGDGIGSLTIAVRRAGLDMFYHDLAGSRTAAFAEFRLRKHLGFSPSLLSETWEPPPGPISLLDYVVALDFFEHMPNVEEWVRWSVKGLRSGGYFVAQNAFAMGDDEHGGSIPMHLTKNNHFEQDWDPLLDSLDLIRDGEWRVKP